MLSQIRHIQKGVLILVTVVIVIAFAFLYSDYDNRGGSPNTAFIVYGKAYRDKEAQVLYNSFDVAQRLMMYDFMRTLFGAQRQDSDRTDYVLNLVILREEAKRLGVQPTLEDVKKAIPNLPIFQLQRWAGEDYIRNNITGPLGFTDADLYQLVKDYLSWKQIRDLLASGIEPTPAEIDRIYIRDFQNISGSVIPFSKEEEEKKLKISDKEIEEYYNENKESKELLSQEKRSASYVHFKIPELKPDATNEQKAEHQEKVNAFKKRVAEVFEKMVAKDAVFKEVAKKHKLEIVKTGAITAANIPKDLEDKNDVLRAIFRANKDQALSTPIAQEDGSYYIVHLDDLQAPAPQSLKDATVTIRDLLKVRKGGEQLQAAAAKVQSSINEAMQAGKSFAEAAEAAAVKPIKLPAFSKNDPPKEIDNAGLIVDTATGMKPKEMSGIVNTPTGAMLVFVDKKFIYESKAEEQRKNTIKGQLSYGDSGDLYDAWFQQKRTAAQPQRSRPVAPPQN